MNERSRTDSLILPLLVAGFAAIADDRPCLSWPNPPGSGIRYDCTSTSSHTVDHLEPVYVTADVWRTRISARREGEPDVLDVTVDSFIPPENDTAVKATLADAVRFTAGPGAGTGWTADSPRQFGGKTSPVTAEPTSITSIDTRLVNRFSIPSSGGTQTFCVGPLGDLPGPLQAVPEAPCDSGLTPVTLRPLAAPPATPLEDVLNVTHVHAQTDRYPQVFASGNLTTTRYEIVARRNPSFPCFTFWSSFQVTVFECRSMSRQTIQHASTASVDGGVWSTRITAKLRGGTPIFDVTINADVSPDLDDAFHRALLDARRAVSTAAHTGTVVNGPLLLSSSSKSVVGAALADGARVHASTTSLPLPSRGSWFCAGDFGDLAAPPSSLPSPPCGSGLSATQTPQTFFLLNDGHTHTVREVFLALTVTGDLTSTHYEYVGELGEQPPVRSEPSVVRPRPH